MTHKVGFIEFYHSYQWLNNSIPHLSEKSNFAVSIVWDLDCANLTYIIYSWSTCQGFITRGFTYFFCTFILESSHTVTYVTTDHLMNE